MITCLRHATTRQNAMAIRDSLEHELHARMDVQSRAERFVFARHIGWYVIRRLTGASYPEIGRWTGGWHHTTVLHGVGCARVALADNAGLWMEIEELCERVQAARNGAEASAWTKGRRPC